MKRALPVVALATGLAACSDDVPRGEKGDYHLVKVSFAGAHPVALMFGFVDDASFCEEVAELYMRRYPGDLYRCEPSR